MTTEEIERVQEYLRDAQASLSHANRLCEGLLREGQERGWFDSEANWLLYKVAGAASGVGGAWETAQQMIERKRFRGEKEKGGAT